MLKLQTNKGLLRVQFYYSLADVDDKPNMTTCLITLDDKHLARGESRCRPGDLFSKEVGRKVALGRAVAGFTRGTRAIFWWLYHWRSPRWHKRIPEVYRGPIVQSLPDTPSAKFLLETEVP